MNAEHLALCASPAWAALVAREVPWALGRDVAAGEVLEVGAGPGLTTDVLRALAPRVTAVELDPQLARALGARLLGTGARVVQADAAALPFAAASFTTAVAFTVLHHVPSAAQQDRVLAELRRVLRPGGRVVGVDGLPTESRVRLHCGDVWVPVDPAALPDRLRAAGFDEPEVEVRDDRFRFAARVPS